MNTAHYHLILSHVPVIGMAFALMLNIWSLLKNSHDLKIATLLLYAISGLFAIPVYFTGDGSERIIKTVPGITESLIEPHEETALYFFIGISIIAAISIAGLLFGKKSKMFLHRVTFIVMILAFINSYFAVVTAYSGGKIRHTEIEKTANDLKNLPEDDD
jgi:phosphoglycerol transferase MdoB-like AlkP superfamily enzyme